MRLILFLLLLFHAGVAAATSTILVIGDSLSAAHNLKIEQGWVALLDRKLAESHGEHWRVVNASISGETSSGGLARLPAALAEHRPAVVLIELGANDGLRGLPLPSLRSNLAQMIRLAREAGAKVGLIGIELPVNYGQGYRDRMREMYRELAAEHDIALLPFLLAAIATDLDNFQEDQVHPTAAAQPAIRDNVFQWMVEAGLVD